MVQAEREIAPYAPVNNVLSVIRRARERNVPNPLTLQELERIGIPHGNAPRTLAALRFLGLVHGDGQHTEEFDRLRRASSAEYPEVLGELLHQAYAPVLSIVLPSEDSDIALNDAFRHYQPEAQRERMIALFRGLCREANFISGGPPAATPRTRRTATERPIARPRQRQRRVQPPDDEPDKGEDEGIDYRLLQVLMQRLPRSGRWTAAERSRWMQAVEAGVDLIVEVVGEAQGG